MSKYLYFFISIVLLIIANYFVKNDVTNQYIFLIWISSIFFLLLTYKAKFSNFKKYISHFVGHLCATKFLISLIIFCAIRIFFISNAYIFKSHYDESLISTHVYDMLQRFLETHSLNMLGKELGTISFFPSLWYCIEALFFYLFGFNLYAGRIFPFFTDLGIFLIIWYFAKRFLKSENIAFFATFFYATFSPAICYSLTTMNNLQSSFFFCLTFLALLCAEEKKDFKSYLFVGFSTGFANYFYLASASIPAYVCLFLFYIFLKNKTFINQIKKFFHFLVGYIYASGPFLIYSIYQYNFVAGRKAAYDYQGSFIQHCIDLFSEHTMMMIKIFYEEPFDSGILHYLPISFFDGKMLSFIFLFGIMISLIKIKKSEYFIILNFFALTFIIGGILTNSPHPASTRLLPFIWTASLFIGIAMENLFNFFCYLALKEKLFKRKTFIRIALSSSIILISYFNFTTLGKVYDLMIDKRESTIDILNLQAIEPHVITGIFPDHTNKVLSMYSATYNYPMYDINNGNFQTLLEKKTPHYFLLFKPFARVDKRFEQYRSLYKKINTSAIFKKSFDTEYELYKFKG